jgi:hypothetical protein
MTTPWNKGKTGLQSAWNKGKHGIYSEDTKRRIGVAASLRNKGRKLTRTHRKKISEAMNRIKMCSQCTVKSQWMYGVIIPSVSEYLLTLCHNCLLDQYRLLSQEDKMTVSIVS